MGILRWITREKTRAENVLSSRAENAVDTWRMPGQTGVKVALFLQFHTVDDQPLQRGSARARFAIRNHYPQTFEFTRNLRCHGGTLGPSASQSRLRVRAAREDDVQQTLVPDIVPVQRDPDADSIEVTAELHCTQPKPLNRIGDTLTVTAESASRRRCPCCLRYFHS